MSVRARVHVHVYVRRGGLRMRRDGCRLPPDQARRASGLRASLLAATAPPLACTLPVRSPRRPPRLRRVRRRFLDGTSLSGTLPPEVWKATSLSDL